MVAYLDSSALVKLVIAEPESAALADWLGIAPSASCALARTEVRRAVSRHPDIEAPRRLDRLFDKRFVVRLVDELLDRAVRLPPTELRPLDAIHVAAALSLGGQVDAVVTYDDQLAAAGRHGLPVVAPGRP